jgi:hypothetical protein
MTKQHKATPEQWAVLEETGTSCMSACILELRARIEALEACDKEDANCWSAVRASMHALRARIEALEATQQRPLHQDKLDRLIMGSPLDADDGDPIVVPSSPAGSLVDRVAQALYDAPNTLEGVWHTCARAAILEVAAWMRAESEGHLGSGLHFARRLEQEANR